MNLLKISLALVIIGITFLSLMPPSTPVEIKVNDKIGHFIAYCVFMLNLGLLLKSKHYLIGALAIIGFSCLMEFFQGFVPGRSVSWLDVLANSTGVGIGILVLILLKQKILGVLTKLRIIRI